MKAAFYTLGCKVNQNETGALEEMFRRAGYAIGSADEAADVFVVNSCTVTAAGDTKSMRALRRAKKLNPHVITVLTGCTPQAQPDQALQFGADVVTGTAGRSRLLQNIAQFKETGVPVVDIAPLQKGQPFEELPLAPISGRTRAFVKIQDGCSRRCAYCLIPTARGPSRSRSEASILEELKQLAAQGYAEVVFTGINLPSYGRDSGTCLADVIEKAALVTGIRRIRLSSLDPDLLSAEDIARFAQVDKLCPHFHLSLQSGCDATLRRMRRPYTSETYARTAQALLSAMPDASLTTDVIVGFPGESEEEFAQSMDFVQRMAFLRVHVFPFSRRPGTAAYTFEGQLSKAEKARRVTAMQAAANAARDHWLQERYGTQHEVLLETPEANGLFTGYTRNYIPVLVSAPGMHSGQIAHVTLGHFDGERCAAQLIFSAL